MTERAGAAEPAPIAPKVIGLMLAGAAVLVAGLWLGDRRGGAEADSLELTIVSPQNGAAVPARVPIVFTTPAQLRPGPLGWRAGRLHLHAEVDGIEHMPGAADVRRVGAGRYEWRLPPLQPGRHSILLRWSGPDHRPIRAGESPAVEVTVPRPVG